MRAKFVATNPDEMSFTLTVTMTLKDWKALREQTKTEHPGWQLRNEITQMVFAAEKYFEPKSEAE